MRIRPLAVSLTFSLTIVVFGFVLMRSTPPDSSNSRAYNIPTRHPVTPEMEKAAASLKRTPLPDLTLPDIDGRLYGKTEMSKGKPSVIFFIKNNCPCSIEAQPIFNNIAKAYAGDANFYAVIDDSADEADKYAMTNMVPFPVLLDPKKKLISALKLVASASYVLVDGEGKVVQLWPGYSKKTIRNVNFLLGALSKSGARDVDDSEAPEKLTAGCAFFESP